MGKPGGRTRGHSLAQKLLGGPVGVGGAAAPGDLKVDGYAAIRERPVRQIAADASELLAVAMVDDGRGVQDAQH